MTVPNEVMELHGKTEVERAVLLYSPGRTRQHHRAHGHTRGCEREHACVSTTASAARGKVGTWARHTVRQKHSVRQHVQRGFEFGATAGLQPGAELGRTVRADS